MKKISVADTLIYGIPVLIVVAVIVLLAWPSPQSSDLPSADNNTTTVERATKDLVLSCTKDMFTTFHIHPELTILINDVRQTIPTNIGIEDANCMHPIHTHEATGKIHVESPKKADFTLGDFFLVWGKTFTKEQILDSTADDTHVITMTVNGEESIEFENLVLRDLDKIVISYKKK